MDPIVFPALPQLDGTTHTDVQGKKWVYSLLKNRWAPLIETTAPVDPILDHNNLTNIQGGAATEYYHMTSAEYTSLQALILGGGGTASPELRHGYLPLPGISYSYCGTAPSGSVDADVAWTVTRISISDAGVVTGTDITSILIAWTDYLAATYVPV